MKIAVIGGGPAGIMAASSAAMQGASVLLIEKNSYLGKKMGITGKGRCNITNACDIRDFIAFPSLKKSYPYSITEKLLKNNEFIKKVLQRLDNYVNIITV